MKTLKPAELYTHTHTHTHTRVILSGIIFALCMFGNAWAGAAKHKKFLNEIPVDRLEFDLPSGNLIYLNGISLSGLSESPQKYGVSNFKDLDYFKCKNDKKYYRRDVNTANAKSVSFYETCDGCGLYLLCNDGYYVDNRTDTTADKCIRQNTVSVVDKEKQKPLKGVRFQCVGYPGHNIRNTNSDGKTLSYCDRGQDKICAELDGYKKQCQTCAENMVFELEKIKKTEKTKEKKSAEKPVTPPAETDGATDADKEKKTNPSSKDVGEAANETSVETENENGTATPPAVKASGIDANAQQGETDDKSTNTKSNENEKQNFDFKELDAILDKYFSDSSNWKNEDGNFNTARLVSDSVAGVVLGTAGGVITSKIIKKNQIKKGFEDLKCTVGGQEVATYGDEFTVGAKQ